jgi:hypothetical protein
MSLPLRPPPPPAARAGAGLDAATGPGAGAAAAAEVDNKSVTSVRAARPTDCENVLSTLNGVGDELSEFYNYVLVESFILHVFIELGSQHRLNEMYTI